MRSNDRVGHGTTVPADWLRSERRLDRVADDRAPDRLSGLGDQDGPGRGEAHARVVLRTSVGLGDRHPLAGLRRRQRGVRPRTRGPRLARARDRAHTRGDATDRAPLRGDRRPRVGDNERRGAGRPGRQPRARVGGAPRNVVRDGATARVQRLRRRRSQLHAGDEHASDPTPRSRHRRGRRDPRRLAALARADRPAGTPAVHQARGAPLPLHPGRVRGRANRRPARARPRVRGTLAHDRHDLVRPALVGAPQCSSGIRREPRSEAIPNADLFSRARARERRVNASRAPARRT